jgi:hypothetical protein
MEALFTAGSGVSLLMLTNNSVPGWSLEAGKDTEWDGQIGVRGLLRRRLRPGGGPFRHVAPRLPKRTKEQRPRGQALIG